MRNQLLVVLVLALAPLFAHEVAGTVIEIPIDPARAYLHTEGPDVLAGDAIPIDLVGLGITEGDTLELDQVGDFSFSEGSFPDDGVGMAGVFSGSSILLTSSLLNRVQDAIDAGPDFFTGPTLFNSEPTDIPEDFEIFGGITIVVPAGATHLFVAPPDSFYGDNADPDGDYALRIRNLSAVSEPGTAFLFVAGFTLLRFRKRRKG